MTNLDTYLSQISEPKVTWVQGVVSSIGTGVVTLSYADGTIQNAAYLKQYTPVVGDLVHVLSFEPMGMLVLGSTEGAVSPPPAPTPVAPTTFNSSGNATYSFLLSTWASSSLLQSADQVACFFYSPAAFTAVSGLTFQQAEIEITRTSGGPPEFVPHLNLSTATALSLPADLTFWRPDVSLPVGVPSWVPLPLGWAQGLVAGTIKGIGIWTDLEASGVYSGTGRVRLTPLSVTI